MLTSSTVDRMLVLMDRYYGNIRRDNFLRDLARKQGVLLVYDQNQAVTGFTTYILCDTEFRGGRITVLYSGDTVIEDRHWGSVRTLRLFVALLDDCMRRTDHDLYWFLLSKGARTYQLLPLYFQRFYPHHANPLPEYEGAMIAYLSELMFGDDFKAETGIVRFGVDADYLRENYDRVPKSAEDRHAEHFLNINPGYRHGDNLPCIAKIHPDNFQPIVKKWRESIPRYAYTELNTQ